MAQEPDRDDRGVGRHYTYYRPTILILLRGHESHGYELAGRMAELGYDHRVTASLYGTLRDMEREGLITSSWNLSGSGGPPRRIYALTASGGAALDEAIPLLVRQHRALGATLDRYRQLDHEAASDAPAKPAVAQRKARGRGR